MPTVNFSVPEDVKLTFNTTFDGHNKRAVIAELMREAVERAQGRQRAQLAVRIFCGAGARLRRQRCRSFVRRALPGALKLVGRRASRILVVDASVALKWFVPFSPAEANAVKAVTILQRVGGGCRLPGPTTAFHRRSCRSFGEDQASESSF